MKRRASWEGRRSFRTKRRASWRVKAQLLAKEAQLQAKEARLSVKSRASFELVGANRRKKGTQKALGRWSMSDELSERSRKPSQMRLHCDFTAAASGEKVRAKRNLKVRLRWWLHSKIGIRERRLELRLHLRLWATLRLHSAFTESTSRLHSASFVWKAHKNAPSLGEGAPSVREVATSTREVATSVQTKEAKQRREGAAKKHNKSTKKEPFATWCDFQCEYAWEGVPTLKEGAPPQCFAPEKTVKRPKEARAFPKKGPFLGATSLSDFSVKS